MQLSVTLPNGYLPDEYGKYASAKHMVADHPVQSFPLTVSDLPAGTKTLALVFIDFDSTPVCGFTWIHWLAANIPTSLAKLPADASRQLSNQFIQGKNSNAGRLVNGDPAISQGYVGPQPPDQDHDYTLTVYALDEELPLADGYWLNDFRHATKGHILDSVSIEIPSRV